MHTLKAAVVRTLKHHQAQATRDDASETLPMPGLKMQAKQYTRHKSDEGCRYKLQRNRHVCTVASARTKAEDDTALGPLQMPKSSILQARHAGGCYARAVQRGIVAHCACKPLLIVQDLA